MKKVGAEFWSNHTSDEKVAAKYQTMAQKAIETEKAKVLASFRNDFMNCLKITTAGLNKNFYPELGNPLKDSFFNNLHVAGLPEKTAYSVIEKSFAEGAANYFNTLFDKATEYMNLSREARAEISNAIGTANPIDTFSADGGLQSAQPASLADRVAAASATAQVSQASNFTVTEQVNIDAEDFKSQLKSSWARRR
jgi:hypothetical protein